MREVSGKDKAGLRTPSTTSSSDGAECPLPDPEPYESEYAGADGSVDPVMVFCLLAAGRGIGNIVAGPLSQVMYHSMPWKGELGAAYGSGFGSLIIFTGITSFGSGICFLGRRLGWC